MLKFKIYIIYQIIFLFKIYQKYDFKNKIKKIIIFFYKNK
jgi:hypothetical protein